MFLTEFRQLAIAIVILFSTGCAGAQIVEYNRPYAISWNANGRAFWAPADTAAFETDANATAVCEAAGPTIAIISNTDDLELLLDATYRTYCIEPGHYGTLTITRSDTLAKAIVPMVPDAFARAPWYAPAHQQVVFDQINFRDGAQWRISGITVRSSLDPLVSFGDRSETNTLEYSLVEGDGKRTENSHSRLILFQLGRDNTVANSVIRNTPRVPLKDSHCIVLLKSKRSTIINNEIYDCAGDGIQFSLNVRRPSDPVDLSETIIEGNDFYVTDVLYADCDTGKLDPKGSCACAENAIDVKVTRSGMPRKNTNVLIRNNLFHGFRRTATKCGGTGSSGPAIVLHYPYTTGVIIENNVFFDSAAAIRIARKPGRPPSGIVIRNNIFADVYDPSTSGSLPAIMLDDSGEISITHNTFRGSGRSPYALGAIRPSSPIQVANNVFIHSGLVRPGNGAAYLSSGNYLTSARRPPVHMHTRDTILPKGIDLRMTDLCLMMRKRTSPTRKCLGSVVPTAGSPFVARPLPSAAPTDFRGRARGDRSNAGAFDFDLIESGP